MALTTTTLSAAVAATDITIKVASATGFAAGSFILVDAEQMLIAKSYTSGTTIPVLRGQNGTVSAAHVSGANATVGLAEDFDDTAPGGPAVTYPSQAARVVTSYSAAGAIAHPTAGKDAVAIINGTSTIAMTVAAPAKDIDGQILYIIGNGKSASTITFAGGIGAAGTSYDVATLQNAGQVGITVMAANGAWVLLNGPITGTSTALSFGIA